MNPLSPLTPAGSLADQGARRKSTVFVIAFAAALHVVVLSGLLFLGCSKEEGNAGKQNSTGPSSANPSTAGEPAPATPAPVADNTAGAVAPVEAGNTGANTAGNAAAPGTGGTAAAAPSSIATPGATEPAPGPGAASDYKVVKGDIALNIAKKNGVTLAALREANKGVDLNKLKIGQPLQIPAPTPKPAVAEKSPAANPTTGATDANTHFVKSGETLLRIAKKHGTTVKAIRAANSLTSDQIKAGQKLIIPAPSSATATPAKTPVGTAALPVAEPAAIPLPAGNVTEVPGGNSTVPK
jgi:LysM repeat protein